jgi:hypothetical protein
VRPGADAGPIGGFTGPRGLTWPAMPWCDGCDRFWTLDALDGGGGGGTADCPNCGSVLALPTAAEDQGAPWHFKLMVAAVVAYLGWRAIQLLVWLVGRF